MREQSSRAAEQQRAEQSRAAEQQSRAEQRRGEEKRRFQGGVYRLSRRSRAILNGETIPRLRYLHAVESAVGG